MKYNTPTSEFEIQAVAYTKLKDHYKFVRGEYSFTSKVDKTKRYRFDIILFGENDNPKLIIECKKPKKLVKVDDQLINYNKALNIPVLLVYHLSVAEDIVNYIQQFYKKNNLTLDMPLKGEGTRYMFSVSPRN